jgi:hypothetical protein
MLRQSEALPESAQPLAALRTEARARGLAPLPVPPLALPGFS